MTAKLLDGEALAARIRAQVTDRVQQLRGHGIEPGLGTILVGDDVPSARYVAMKHEDCAQVGVNSVHRHLPAGVAQHELLSVIAAFNADPAVSAYILQVPIPAGLDEAAA
ncbi:MAG: tetrahydrofolate dehydrogenase/cyclohydrolase catalytic domain-containing protein, partial [Acidimicrobiales bacterium]